jgi:nicotinamide riboside kinase
MREQHARGNRRAKNQASFYKRNYVVERETDTDFVPALYCLNYPQQRRGHQQHAEKVTNRKAC